MVTRAKATARNLREFERSLSRREQRARQEKVRQALIESLRLVWRDAAQFTATATKFWPAGRDAAIALIDSGHREEGTALLQSVLATLRRCGAAAQSAACLNRSSRYLTDEELLDTIRAIDPEPHTIAALTDNLRDRAVALVRSLYESQPTAELTRMLGRLIAVHESSNSSTTLLPDEYGLELRALRFQRAHGAETARGISYEAQYALWRLLSDTDLEAMDLQDLEDIALLHRRADGTLRTEHVQAKRRDGSWSLADMQSLGENGNRVFDSFAEVFLADPDAIFTFATDSKFERRDAPELIRAAQKFRTVTPDPDSLRGATLTNVGLNTAEERAITRLRERMRPELIARVDLARLLSHVTFDAEHTQRELVSETIRHISALLYVPDPEAKHAYHAFIGLLVMEMQERTRFLHSEIDALIERAGVMTRAFRDRLVGGGRVEVLDFDRFGTASPDLYYQGLATAETGVATGLDALRPTLVAQIAQTFTRLRACIIRAPSGQGKTTLMYRYAYEVSGGTLVLRVHGLDHAAVAEIQRLLEPLQSTAVLVLIDNLATGIRMEWPGALRRLLSFPNVTVLATSREDDWRIAEATEVEGLVDFVRPALDAHTAQVLFDALHGINGVQMHAAHWYEPFEEAEGLLMEYVHILTQGRRIRDVIGEQLAGLEHRLGEQSHLVINALRYIATMHAYGGYLSRTTLMRLLPAARSMQIGRALRVLQDEFWVRDADDGRYVGLHQVRSAAVMNVIHADDPIGETIKNLLAEADADEVGAMLEDLLYNSPNIASDAIDILASRTTREGGQFGLRIATAAYAAEERRYADAVVAELGESGRRGRRALFAVWRALPTSFDFSNTIALLTETGQTEVRAMLARLPRRKDRERLDQRYLASIGVDRLTEWLLHEGQPEHLTDLLVFLVMSMPDLGREVLARAGVSRMAERIREAEPRKAMELLAALRALDAAFATEMARGLGTEFLTERALATTGCYAIGIVGEQVRGRFLVNQIRDHESPNDAAVRVTTALYSWFPHATQSEVTGFLTAGIAHPDARKTIPRENMPPARYQIALNQFWLALCSERLAADSLITVLQQQDTYGRALLGTIGDTYEHLDHGLLSQRTQIISLWDRIDSLSATFPYQPYRTSSLDAALRRSQIGNSLPGSQPLEESFGKITGAVTVIRRELASYLARQDCNRPLLRDQFSQILRELARYRDIRAAIPNLGDLDDAWIEALHIRTEQLSNAVDRIKPSILQRRWQTEAQMLHRAVAELIAVAGTLVAEAQEFSKDGGEWTNAKGKISALREAIATLPSAIFPWRGTTTLTDLADYLARRGNGGGGASEPDLALVTAMTLLRQLEIIRPLDLEVWLAENEEADALKITETNVVKALRDKGVEAICQVLPFSIEQPLYRSAIVVVYPYDLRQLEQIRAVVRQVSFRILPSSAQHLIMLLSHEAGEIMPQAFDTWNTLNDELNPYQVLIGLGKWAPLLAPGRPAVSVGLEVDKREHLIASGIMDLLDTFDALRLTLGQMSAIIETTNDSAWVTDMTSLVDQLAEVAQRTQDVIDKANALTQEANDDPRWLPVALHAFHATGRYLDWLGRRLRDPNTPDETVALQQGLTDARALADTMLYLDHYPGVPLDAGVVSLTFSSGISDFANALAGLIATQANPDED